MKNKINEIWTELETKSVSSSPFIMKSYPGMLFTGFYIALTLPEKKRTIAIQLKKDYVLNLKNWDNLREISLLDYPDFNNSELRYFLIQLQDNQHKDIFSVLCEDLISSIIELTDEKPLIKEIIYRLEKWKSLFDKVSLQGLTSEEQRGLYGELIFLRKLLQFHSDFQQVLTSWVGVEKQIKDFQFGSWCVEVKTTHGNNHQKIHISSERQLDTTNLENLFLFHLSLESRLHSGETLNDIVDSVRLILEEDFSSLSKFNNKLLEAGYFDNHRLLYSESGYFIRNEAYYKVENEFPRIEEAEIRKGVGDVKYSIIISQYSEYLKTEQQVFQNVIYK